MVSLQAALFFLAFSRVSHALTTPSYSTFTLVWNETFIGDAGSPPNTTTWNIKNGNLGFNNELETYTTSNVNVQLSGNETVQLIPWRNATELHGWTSGRIESTYTMTPADGVQTLAEAQIRFGSNPPANKQGYWPAFWMLGESYRTGAQPWPACGELDILETVDGVLTGYGTAHCGVDPGGPCHESNGLGGSIAIPNQDWQVWQILWDRTQPDWTDETITWFMNGTEYHQINGQQVGEESVWASLCHSPMYFILDMAVGGNWPGNPNAETEDGDGSMMEVGYVAIFASS